MKGPWFITPSAVEDYCRITRCSSRGEAMDDLVEMATETAAAAREPKVLKSGALRYKGGRGRRAKGLFFLVSEAERDEGGRPQLIQVMPPYEGYRPGGR